MAILRNDTTVRSADGQTTSPIITAANIGNYGISTTSTYYIGTTQNVFNRASGAQTLTGVSIDGNAANITAYTINQNVGTGNAPSFTGMTSTAMLVASTSMNSVDDWQNSPISIRERGLVAAAQSANTYSPNLNFHWASRISNSLWMDANGNLSWGSYDGTGVPSSDGAFYVNNLYASIYFDKNNTSYYLDAANSGTSLLVAGNVGIGNTSPSAKLHVLGASYTTASAANNNVRFEGGGGNGLGFGTIDATSTYASWIQSGYVPNFATATYALLLNPLGGNVGIGTTSPAAKFQVGTHSTGDAGNGDNSANVRIGAASAGARVYGLTLANTATATVGNDSSISFIVAGNYSATGIISTILRNTTTAASDLVFTNYNNGLNERMRIQYDGNVGIGTTSPSQKLHVIGTGFASADFRAPIFYDSDNTTYYLDPNASTSGNLFGVLKQNDGKFVRDSYFRTISGTGDYYASGASGWYTVASITLTTNCTGGVLYGTLYDNRYDGADTYQIAIVARAECDFQTNNESHYVNVGCTILGSTNITNYQSKIRVLLVASSANSRTYEVQFFETSWNRDTWQLETGGSPVWTIYSTAQAPGTSTGTARVFYISNKNADNIRANTASYSPIYYDSNDTSYYSDPAGLNRFNALNIGNQGALTGNTTYALGAYHNSRYMVGLRYSSGGAAYPWLVHDSWNGSAFIIHFNGVGDKFNFSESGIGQASGDFRAPIFYDSGDTTYYLDPANTGTALAIAGNAGVGTASPTLSSGKGIHINSSSGHANLKLQSSGRTWELLSTTGAYFSVYDTTGGADRLAVTSAGNVGVATTSADTNLQVVGHVHVGNQTTFDNTGGWSKTIYLDGTYHARLRILGSAYASGKNSQTETYLWVDNTVSPYSGLVTNAGSFTINAGFTTLTNSARSPIFYDSDNTAYYIDAASTSVLNTATISTVQTNAIAKQTNGSPITINSGLNAALGLRVYYDMQLYNTLFFTTSGWGEEGRIYGSSSTVTIQAATATTTFVKYAGYSQEGGSFRAPIFYDSDNTSYYIDAASTSNLNSLVVAASARVGGAASRSTSGLTVGFTDNSTFAANTDVGDTDRMLSIVNESSTTNAMSVLGFRVNPNGGTANAMMDIKFVQTGATNTSALYYTFNHGGTFADRLTIQSSGNIGVNTSDFSYTSSDNSRLVGSNTSNRLFVNGSIQLLNNNDAIVIGRGTATFLSDEELGFGWGGGWYMTDGTYLRVRNDKVLYTAGEIWGSIFKDSNNTSYYLDPASTSNLNVVNLIGITGAGAAYIQTSTTGTSYTSHFQIREANGGGGNTSEIYAPALGFHWSGVVASNILMESSGRIAIRNNPGSGYENFIANAIYGAVFYDSNDTNYYVDPASTSVMLYVRAANFHDSTGSYNVNLGSGNSEGRGLVAGYSGGSYGGIGYNVRHTTTGGSWIAPSTDTSTYLLFSNGVYFYYAAGGAAGRTLSYSTIGSLTSAGIFTVSGDVRAPLFYDSNNTAYYLDPASTSNLNVLNAVSSTTLWVRSGSWAGDLTSNGFTREIGMQMTGGSEFVILSKSGQGYTLVDGSYYAYEAGGFYSSFNSSYGAIVGFSADSTTSVTFNCNVKAPIYYDSNNTSYYVDPASTSNLNALTVAGGNATIYRDLIVNGGASGSFGNRIIVQGTATTYTLQDTTFRPTVYLNGDYPVVTLNCSATTNANHGPTLQFAFNGLTTGGSTSRQIVIGANGVGSWLDFGFSGGAFGDNANYNPHNGISGYSGITAMRLFSNGLLVGSTGTYPNHITSTSYALDVRGTGYSNTDFRAPIFYDSDNTGYYLNPAGSSQLSSVYANDWFRAQGNTGLYFQDKGYGITSAGAASNSYGNASTYGTGLNGWQGWGIGSRHCMMSTGGDNFGIHDNTRSWLYYWDGTYHNFQYGYLQSASSVRGPLFYDSDNTAYYCDPASTSNLNAITAAGNVTAAQYYTGGWFRNNSSGNGLYNESTTQHFYSDDVSYWNVASSSSAQGIRFRTGGHGGTVRGYVYANNGNDVGFLNNGGNWRARIVGGDYFLADGSSIRGQIFYDSNDTNYYCDPNSSSVLASVTANAYYPRAAVTESDIYAQSLSINAYHHGDSLTYDTFQFNAASTYETRATVGASFVSGTVETSIFKGDRFGGMSIANGVYQVRWTWNNTIGYKFFKTLYLGNSTNGNSFTVTIEASGNGSTWTTIATSTAMSNWPGHSWYNYAWNNNAYQGYIRLTITPSWSTVYGIDIYSMRYFCSYSLDAGSRLYDWDYSKNVTFAAAVSSPIFYDSNNTGYYVNPASQSKLNNLLIDTGSSNTSMTIVGSNQPSIFLKTTDNERNIEIFNSYGNFGIYRINAPSNYIIYHVDNGASSYTYFQLEGTARLTINSSGSTATTSVRSPIFYDSDNTAYFIDGAGTSNILGLTVNNTITGSVSGNAGTATTLQTARNINGTSFNGSANITTASWGTARTITIGATGKSVDGSANASWSLAEITGSQTANTFLAAPNGSAGNPTFRAIVAADIPTLNQNTTGTAANVTGTVAIANGGTGATTAANAATNLGLGTGNTPKFLNVFGERASVTASASTTVNTQFNVTELTMSASITTLTLSNIQANTIVHMWTIVTLGNGTGYSITWPAAIKWPGGTAPTITSTNAKRDIYQFVTYDGGTNIYAIIVGQNL